MNLFNRLLTKQQIQMSWLFLSISILVMLVAGPGMLLIFPLRRWASRQIWEANDRWTTIWCFAIVGWISYLPLIVFHRQFVATWQNVPFLGLATLVSWRFRSFLMLFLVPAATLLLERIRPKTNTILLRVKYTGDMVQQSSESPPIPLEAGKREKRKAPPSKAPRFLRLTVHRAGTKARRDPQLSGVVLRKEKQRQLSQGTVTTSVSVTPSPPASSKSINWDEGEGTYSEK